MSVANIIGRLFLRADLRFAHRATLENTSVSLSARQRIISKRCCSTILLNASKRDQWQNTQRTPKIPAFLLLAAAALKAEDNEDSPSSEDIQDLLRTAKQLSSKGDKLKVEKIYLKALHLALERKETSMVADIQDKLASMAIEAGDYDKARTLLLNVTKNLINIGMKENDMIILEISLKLASIYATLRKHDTALNGYKWVIEKTRENLEKSKSLENTEEHQNNLTFLGMCLDSYGRYLFMLKKTKQALDVTKEAIDISTELFGESDIRTLVLLNDLGAILSDCNEFEEAEKIIENVIKNAKKSKDVKHSDIAVFWVNLGSICLNQKKSAKAADAFKYAKKEAVLSRNRSLQLQVEHFIAEYLDQ